MATGFDSNGLGIRSDGTNYGSANQEYPPGCACKYAVSGGIYFGLRYENDEDWGSCAYFSTLGAGNGKGYPDSCVFRLA